jgi:hypothetical protein
MIKKILITLLTLLLLPIGVSGGALIVAILAVGLTLAFPALVLGLSLKSAGYISEKLMNWLFPKKAVDQSKSFSRFTIASIVLSFLLTLLGVAPAAAVILVAAAIATPLFFVISAAYIPFWIARKAVNAIFLCSEMNNSASENNRSFHIQEEQTNTDDFEPSSLASKALGFFTNPLKKPALAPATAQDEVIDESNEEQIPLDI